MKSVVSTSTVRFIDQLSRARHAPAQILPYLKYRANRLPAHWNAQGQSWPPRRILLGVNSVCNENCAMCDFGQNATDRMFFRNLRPTHRPLELPLERLCRLIDEVKPFRPVLEAHTVEPTLYRRLPELAEYAARNRLPFRVFTNGVQLAHMADALVAAGVDQIYVSIDGPAAVHDSIRHDTGSFERALQGIAAVNAACRRRPNCRTKVRVNTTISNLNYGHLIELVQAVEAVAPFCFMFMHLNFVTTEMVAVHNLAYSHICQATLLGIGGTDPHQVDTAVLYGQLRQIKERFPARRILIQPNITTEAELETYYHRSEVALRPPRCFMPWRTTMIMPDGGVIVRNRCYHVVFGNIFEQNLMDIWNNRTYTAFRQALKQAGAFPACVRCYGMFE
jgi:Fe-coproporphyrin III synthase